LNTVKIIVAIIVGIGVVIVAVAVNYSWVSGCVYTGGGTNVHYAFSEFEEINGTGVYVSEVLQMNRGKMDQCSNDNKIAIRSLDIYLMDNQGLTNFTGNLWSLQDNYAGNIEEKVNFSTEIRNDNGTLTPIHFENQMDNDFETYGESSDFRDNDDELYLSIGDKIKVYGSGSEANGPAESDWTVRIKFTPTGDSITYDLVIP
tara:strand:- start:38 stop:643 length:606 start_codon:yes stop_codon:yes gene_type:complete